MRGQSISMEWDGWEPAVADGSRPVVLDTHEDHLGGMQGGGRILTEVKMM